MKLLFTTTLLLFGITLSAQYNYGLEVEQQDAKIEGKLNIENGNGNVSIGMIAGIANTTGFENTFIGRIAGANNTTGFENTYIGTGAGANNTTGNKNTYIGTGAGANNTTGFENTFIGRNAGAINSTGYYNTFIGRSAGSGVSTGIANTYLGMNAGRRNTTGSENTFIGRNAGLRNTAGSFNLIIGHGAGPTVGNPAPNNTLYIDVVSGFDGDDNPLIYGEFDNDLVKINGTLHISETAKLKPQATAPTCATGDMGTLYADTGGVLYFCNGTAWKTVQLN